eukprot:jgi/Psemu1/58427/gm1.58427_g
MPVPLTRHIQLKLQRFIDFGRHLTEQGLDWEERDHYTKNAFKNYCQGIVHAKRDSAVTTRATISTDGHGWPPKLIAQLQYESWIRKPRDATTFPVLHNDATFEHWLVPFKAQLEANGINSTTFLDPYWSDHALKGYPKALYDKHCAFFWTLLRHVFQGDFSSSCVLYHQRTRDGRLAYFTFVKLRNPVSPPTSPAAPESTHAPVHSTSNTPAAHNSPPTAAYKTPAQPTVDNPEHPTELPGSSHNGSTDDPTSTGTYSYTWKYSPSTDSVRFRRIAYSSTPSIAPADTPTGNVLPKRNHDSHSTRNRESHSPRAGTSYPPPANSRWTFYPQSETVVFNRPHQPVTTPQSSCISSLPLPPSGAFSKDSVVPSSVHAYSPYGASSYQARKPIYGAHRAPTCSFRQPLYSAYSMITKRHRDAIKINLYQLHATLFRANWLYDDVT